MFILQRIYIQKQYIGLLNNTFITGVLHFFPKKNKSQFRSIQNCCFIMLKKYESNNVPILANKGLEPSLLNVIKANL